MVELKLLVLLHVTLSLQVLHLTGAPALPLKTEKCPWLEDCVLSGSTLSPLRGPHLHEQQRETGREGGIERGAQVFIEKWGFAMSFLAMNHFRTKCPSFLFLSQHSGWERGCN